MFLLLSCFFGVVWGQQLPECAVNIHDHGPPTRIFRRANTEIFFTNQATCLGTFVANSTCDATDAPCICGNKELMKSIETCTIASCTIKEGLSKSLNLLDRSLDGVQIHLTWGILAARNATATMCDEPVRDITQITPIVNAVSGAVATICVIMRIADRYPYWERLQWADLCVVIALVSFGRNLF